MSLLETNFLVLDTETTGLDSSKDKVVEVAAVKVRGSQLALAYHSLINPGIPIPPETSAVHGIADWDVVDKPLLEAVWSEVQTFIAQSDCLVAHNAPFDCGFLPEVDKPWLDTYRLAQHLWSDAPNHKNQTLRYWKGLKLKSIAHSADGDTLVTAYLLVLMIRDYLAAGHLNDLQALIDYAEAPIFVQRMPFGKHFGTPLQDVPFDYLRWVLNNVTDNMTSDLRWSIEKVLRGEMADDRSASISI